jgi:hypothetical protein
MPSAAPAAPASYYPPVRRAAGQGPGLVRVRRPAWRNNEAGRGFRTKADRVRRRMGEAAVKSGREHMRLDAASTQIARVRGALCSEQGLL